MVHGVIAALWFFALLVGMVIATDGQIIERKDVLFESDAGLVIDRLVTVPRPPIPRSFILIHPLCVFFWRPISIVLSYILGLVIPAGGVKIAAAAIMVNSVAGVGVGALAYLALRRGERLLRVGLLILLYMLFTSSLLVALPEHWGLSSGLMTLTFVVSAIDMKPRSQVVILCVLTVLVAGTTLTNGLLPLFFLVLALRRHNMVTINPRLITIAAVAIPVLMLAGWALLQNIENYVSPGLHVRLIRQPLEAVAYMILGIVFPSVGPSPHVVVESGALMLSNEPLRTGGYGLVQGISTLAWVILLFMCSFKSLQNSEVRPFALVLVVWLLFNLFLHNIWSDEFFLYAPHWSWALMALVFLGAQYVPLRIVLSLVLLTLPGQIVTLVEVGSILRALT